MAAIARQTFEDLRDEALARLTKTGAGATLTSRVEYLVAAAYFDLCERIHHYELHVLDQSLTATINSAQVTLPTDCRAVLGVGIRDTSSVYLGSLSPKHTQNMFLLSREIDAGQPAAYARLGADLIFDRPADQAYEIDLLYYKRPAAPDYSSGSPLIDRVWDEHIVQYALSLAFPAFHRYDLGALQAQTLEQYLVQQIQQPLAADASEIGEQALTTPKGGRQ